MPLLGDRRRAKLAETGTPDTAPVQDATSSPPPANPDTSPVQDANSGTSSAISALELQQPTSVPPPTSSPVLFSAQLPPEPEPTQDTVPPSTEEHAADGASTPALPPPTKTLVLNDKIDPAPAESAPSLEELPLPVVLLSVVDPPIQQKRAGRKHRWKGETSARDAAVEACDHR